MEEIKEIIQIISKNKTNKVEIIGQSVSETKLFKLYDLITKGEVATDQEAIDILYPDAKNARSSYFKLKYFLRRRLLNTIFFINTGDGEETAAYVKLLRKLVEVRILIVKGGKNTGLKVAKKLLLKAEHQEFWDVAVFAARFIRRYYVVSSPDFKQFQDYNKKLEYCLQVNAFLMEVEGMYYQLVTHMISNKSTNKELFDLAKKYETQLENRKNVLPSTGITFYASAITAIKHMNAYNYVEAIGVLESAMLEFKNMKHFNGYHTVCLINLVACNTYLKQYEAGRLNLAKALSYTSDGSFNWTQAKSTHVTLAFHSKKYTEIPAIYLEVTKHLKFKKIPSIFREIWTLYYAWLYLLSKMELVELPPRFIPKKFKLEDWLGEIKETAKDKNGLSINIRIIRTVAWLLDEDYDALIDHDDSLKRFRYRYVKNSAQRRANLILRYLINIQKREFVDYKCEYITESAKEAFAKMPVELKWENFEIEVIPFDDVVDLLSGIMKSNARRIRE